VIAIPTGSAARDEWAALPETVRAEAIRLAALGEGHPDPAVAAVVVGRIRAGAPPTWWMTVLWAVGLSGFFGSTLALIYIGGVIAPPGHAILPLLIGPALLGLAFFADQELGPSSRPAEIPAWVEIPNLRVVLGSPDVSPSSGPPRPYRLRHAAVAATLAAAGIVYCLGLIAWLDLHSDIGRATSSALILSIFWVVWYFARLARDLTPASRRVRRWHWRVGSGRIPLRISDRGLRFGWGPTIPWDDVLGVSFHGPTPTYPDIRPQLVWQLRDRPAVPTPLHAGGRLPEDVILTVRRHKALTPA
jgi:hypothetical protein